MAATGCKPHGDKRRRSACRAEVVLGAADLVAGAVLRLLDAHGLLGRHLTVRLDAACEKLAVPRDTHPWRPHLTVARVREGERDAGRVLEASGLTARTHDMGTLRIDAISLMKSEMRPDGPVHTPVWTVAIAR